MNAKEVLKELESYGSEAVRKIYFNHGAKEPIFGVKVQDMKKILKKTKKNHELSLDLYATGNADAMYLAGLMADEKQISKDQLRQWAQEAHFYFNSEYTVPWIAAETPYGYELGLEWIESDQESIAACGWSTLANNAGVKPDEALDIAGYRALLDRIEKEIHRAQNRVRYTMNGFVITIGGSIVDLTEKAREVAKNIGKVSVDMGGTACKVPLATDYIQKIADRGSLGKKRKAARC